MFKIGDKVVRTVFNDWWCVRTRDKGTEEYTVLGIAREGIICIYIPGWGRTNVEAKNFTLAKEYTKEEKLLNKINKLYKKCPSTAHWST